jgi:hypothetical protein
MNGLINDAFRFDPQNINRNTYQLDIDGNFNINNFKIHYNDDKITQNLDLQPLLAIDANLKDIINQLLGYIILGHETVVTDYDVGNNITLGNILSNPNIYVNDKLYFLNRYKNLDVNIAGIGDNCVFRGNMPNKLNNYTINKGKFKENKVNNLAHFNPLLENKQLILANIPEIVQAPQIFSRKQLKYNGAKALPLLTHPGFPNNIFFAFTYPNLNVDDNSILSLINCANLGRAGVVILPDINHVQANTMTSENIRNLHELLLGLFTFIYNLGFDNVNMSVIKSHLENIANSKSLKDYMSKRESYLLNATAQYVAYGIDDIIRNAMKITIIIVAHNIMNIEKFNNATKGNIYLATDIISIILKNFCYLTYDNDIQPYSIFNYSDNVGHNNNFNNDNLSTCTPLFKFCVMKLLSVTFGRNYQLYKEVIFKYLLTNVIYVINTSPKFTIDILFWFIRIINGPPPIDKYSFLLFVLYRKILYYINFYELGGDYNVIYEQFYDKINLPSFKENIHKNNVKKLMSSNL